MSIPCSSHSLEERDFHLCMTFAEDSHDKAVLITFPPRRGFADRNFALIDSNLGESPRDSHWDADQACENLREAPE